MPIDARQAFATWRARHARRAWRPVCVEGGEAGAQFGGSPVLGTGEPWPRCEGCHQPMQFFLQLPLTSLPRGFAVRGEGTLQLFCCLQDDGRCETWRPFSGTHVVRLLREPANMVRHPLGLAAFPLRSVERWSEFVDYPHPEEHERLGVVYRYDFKRRRVSVSCNDLGLALRDLDLDSNVAEDIADAEAGDKLGGWPLWILRVEYPGCPKCGSAMDFVLQIDSEGNVPYLFGDAGCGHITQCPEHPEVLAFGWACS